MAKNKRKQVHQNEDDETVYDLPQSDTRAVPERPAKKRRSDMPDAPSNGNALDTSKPTALFTPKKGREWTLSMAVPGSIVSNVKKPELKTLLAGRIARAAAVFCVDEIVVYDDNPMELPDSINPKYRKGSSKKTKAQVLEGLDPKDMPWQDPDQFMHHLLSYAECPPYLRRDEDQACSQFPFHESLQWAGMLPSLDMPHHLKNTEWCRYREGVAIGPVESVAPPKSKAKPKRKSTTTTTTPEEDAPTASTYIKCGLPFPVRVAFAIPRGMRVTLKFATTDPPPSWPNLGQKQCEDLSVEAVDPAAPREEEGYYWGYETRRASSISDVLTSCKFENGYDVSIGTSERGAPLSAVLPEDLLGSAVRKEQKGVARLPEAFKHLLIVFGGVAGIELAVDKDPELKGKIGKETAGEMFDGWVNLVQGQGSRTIRTEEAVEFGLFGLKGYVDSMYG
ncbi:DUF171-domain-containing protein [Massarina eburnea CBS 473.64]|uniref:DUF171-domain-containing protein n=1 Tax=Massarina eburnea CBS 473.64 TaxID=1395130 RepID=A0A6A6S9G3_9PLEO|nr:DUF171-domain-containing protein [Massarina eburnea CBS 473.64]